MSANRGEPPKAPENLEDILDLSWRWRFSLMTLEAHKAGVFDAAAGGWKNAEAIARAIKADRRAARLLLQGLSGAGVMEKEGDNFRNTPAVERFLVKSSPDYAGSTLDLDRRAVDNWSRISEVVRSGSPIPKPETSEEEKDAWQETFIKAMDAIARLSSGCLLDALPLVDGQRVLDIGCGPATYLVEILKRHPNSTAVAFDRPNSENVATQAARAAGVEARLSFVGGDFTQHDFEAIGPFDGVLISQVIHIVSGEKAADLINRASLSVKPGGFMAVHEMTLGPDENPGGGAVFAVQMMLGTQEGKVYTREEIISMMESAGMSNMASSATDSRSEVIVGKNLSP